MRIASLEPVRFGVGIDTARYGHHVSFMDAERELVAPGLAVSESAEGYQRLRKQLEKLRGKHPNAHFHVHLDAGGQYATNLEYFLRGMDLPITLSIGQPKQNKDYHRAMSPKLKSDASESRAMARFGVVERPAATPQTPEEIYALREIASRLEAQVKSTTQAINRLHNLLARVFPELATITAYVASGWVLKLLDKYPTPERIARAAFESLTKIPHVRQEKAKKLQEAAKGSVASLRGGLAEQLCGRQSAKSSMPSKANKHGKNYCVRRLPRYRQPGTCKSPRLRASVKSRRLCWLPRSFRSISLKPRKTWLVTSVCFLKSTARELIATAILSGEVGTCRVKGTTWCDATCSVLPRVRSRTTQPCERSISDCGHAVHVAMWHWAHCMRKLLHLVFAVWTTNQPFDKNHYPWQGPAEETASDQPAEPNGAQEKTAGPRRDVIPASKEVTAAESTVDGTADRVNPVESGRESHGQTTAKSGPIDYAYIREQITIEQVLRRMGHYAQLSGRGVQLSGHCPFHKSANEKSHCFSVNLEKNVFQCKNPKCAAHGNALDLWVKHSALPLYEATLHLADTFGLEIRREQKRRGNP